MTIPDRNSSIAEIEARRKQDEQRAIDEIKKLQADCPHDKIVESPRRSSEYGSSSPARRICVCCGVEEVIRYSSWPDHTIDGGAYEFVRAPGQRTILNSDFIKKGDVCQYRVRL